MKELTTNRLSKLGWKLVRSDKRVIRFERESMLLPDQYLNKSTLPYGKGEKFVEEVVIKRIYRENGELENVYFKAYTNDFYDQDMVSIDLTAYELSLFSEIATDLAFSED